MMEGWQRGIALEQQRTFLSTVCGLQNALPKDVLPNEPLFQPVQQEWIDMGFKHNGESVCVCALVCLNNRKNMCLCQLNHPALMESCISRCDNFNRGKMQSTWVQGLLSRHQCTAFDLTTGSGVALSWNKAELVLFEARIGKMHQCLVTHWSEVMTQLLLLWNALINYWILIRMIFNSPSFEPW